MPITIPKPILLMPKVPGVLVIGLLAAQFLLFQSGNGPDPKCTLRVEQPHYSTSLKENQNVDAIKLNITSTCNVPQSYTKVNASIQKIENNLEVTARTFCPEPPFHLQNSQKLHSSEISLPPVNAESRSPTEAPQRAMSS